LEFALLGVRDMSSRAFYLPTDLAAYYLEVDRCLTAAVENFDQLLDDQETMVRLPLPAPVVVDPFEDDGAGDPEADVEFIRGLFEMPRLTDFGLCFVCGGVAHQRVNVAAGNVPACMMCGDRINQEEPGQARECLIISMRADVCSGVEVVAPAGVVCHGIVVE